MNSAFKSLKKAIHIQNEYFRIAGPILEQVKESSKEFIGKKVVTQKGLSSKYYDAVKIDYRNIKVKPIPGATFANVHHVSVRDSYDNLHVEISVCFGEPTVPGCVYESRTWYFGKTENGILTTIHEDVKVPTTVLDYDTELAAIKKFRELEKHADEAEEKINIHREAYKYINLDDFED
nr:hypothetical protein [uncultured Flavobacterium sp.]